MTDIVRLGILPALRAIRAMGACAPLLLAAPTALHSIALAQPSDDTQKPARFRDRFAIEVQAEGGRTATYEPIDTARAHEKTYFAKPRGYGLTYGGLIGARFAFVTRVVEGERSPVFGLRLAGRGERYTARREDAASGRFARIETDGQRMGACAGLFLRPVEVFEMAFCNGFSTLKTRSRFYLAGRERSAWKDERSDIEFAVGVRMWILSPLALGVSYYQHGNEGSYRGGLTYAL